jgi:hypothetical protein
VHGGAHEAVNKDGSRFFIDFVFDRIGVHRDLDDYVKGFREFFSGTDFVKAHEYLCCGLMGEYPNLNKEINQLITALLFHTRGASASGVTVGLAPHIKTIQDNTL